MLFGRHSLTLRPLCLHFVLTRNCTIKGAVKQILKRILIPRRVDYCVHMTEIVE